MNIDTPTADLRFYELRSYWPTYCKAIFSQISIRQPLIWGSMSSEAIDLPTVREFSAKYRFADSQFADVTPNRDHQ